MKKSVKILLITVGILAAIWCALFAIDFARVNGGGEPIFVVPYITADDGGSGTYLGLGYTAEIEKYMDAEYGVRTTGVELRIFGKVVAAWIACPDDPVPDEWEMADYSIDGLDFVYHDRRYALTEAAPSVNALMSCTPVGEHSVIEGHAGPYNCVYFIFNAREEVLEATLSGTNLIWRGDDITTAVYSFWEGIYAYDGTQIAEIAMEPFAEYIYALAFTEDGGLLVTVYTEDDLRTERIAPEQMNPKNNT